MLCHSDFVLLLVKWRHQHMDVLSHVLIIVNERAIVNDRTQSHGCLLDVIFYKLFVSPWIGGTLQPFVEDDETFCTVLELLFVNLHLLVVSIVVTQSILRTF